MTNVDLATADGQDRYVPTATRDITSAGHEGVYEWVAEHLVKDGMRALDFGSGTGYGVGLMARAGATVDGADSSPTAVAHATETYGGPRAKFFVADLVESVPAAFALKSYDLVVSSEVLEHVVDPFAYVRRMAELCKDDGVCFVGTPNRLWSFEHVPDGHLLARSHLMEFTPPALDALLHTVFGEVRLMLRVFPKGSMSVVDPPIPPIPPRPRIITAAAALVRKVSPAAVERIKRVVDPNAPPVPVPKPPQEWLASDIAWLDANDPAVDMAWAVGLVAICHKPRRDGRAHRRVIGSIARRSGSSR